MNSKSKRLRLQDHLNGLIEHPVSQKDFEENYTHEFHWTNKIFMDLIYLLHLHGKEIEALKAKLEAEAK